MDALITNLAATPVFIPGPNLDLAAAGDPDGNHAKTWPNILVSDLDASAVIKAGVVGGTLAVTVTPDALDAAVATQGSLGFSSLERYTVANLPTGFGGRIAFAINGRAGAEGGGAGTGTMVVFSNAQWRRVEDLAVVAA